MRVALRRAAHQMFDDPKVLDDPLAVRIVGEVASEVRTEVARYQSRIAKHFRAFMVVRSRYAEDQLAASVAGGVDQYVILGAGLDTSAYRGVASSGVNIFEVDHPDTQAGKIKCLQTAQISIPGQNGLAFSFLHKLNCEDERERPKPDGHARGFASRGTPDVRRPESAG